MTPKTVAIITIINHELYENKQADSGASMKITGSAAAGDETQGCEMFLE